MDKTKLTIENALRYLAANCANDEFYIRIGWHLLDIVDVSLDTLGEDKPNKYLVKNMKNGERYEYNDLFKAVVRFVDIVNND